MHDLFVSEAYPSLMKSEGKYSNDGIDSGGETWKGIARNKNPRWGGWTIVDQLRNEPNFPQNLEYSAELEYEVVEFYREEFWTRVGADCMPPALALEVFDTGVNCGQATAVKFLQRVLNVMNKAGTLYPDIVVDGKWGPGTKAALDAYLETRKNLPLLLVTLNCLQGAHYITCAEQREANETYEFGWLLQRVMNQLPKI